MTDTDPIDTLQAALERGELEHHGHPAGEACDDPKCYQAFEMYPDG